VLLFVSLMYKPPLLPPYKSSRYLHKDHLSLINSMLIMFHVRKFLFLCNYNRISDSIIYNILTTMFQMSFKSNNIISTHSL